MQIRSLNITQGCPTLEGALHASLLPCGAEEKPKDPKPAAQEEAKEDTQNSDSGEVDPFAAPTSSYSSLAKVPASRLKEARAALRLRLETWEVPNLDIARSLDHLGDAAALTKLRDEWLAGKEGIKLLWCPAQGLDASTRMTTEAIVEKIFPTEYMPPVLPKDVPGETKPGKKSTVEKIADAVVGHCTPTAFDTRNTGRTIESVAHPVSVEKSTWDVSLTLEDVELSGTDSFGPEDLSIKMPQFTSFRTGGLLRLKEGEWRLVSVMDPPRGISPTATGKQFVTMVRIDRTSP
jgi:hypothetical protein